MRWPMRPATVRMPTPAVSNSVAEWCRSECRCVVIPSRTAQFLVVGVAPLVLAALLAALLTESPATCCSAPTPRRRDRAQRAVRRIVPDLADDTEVVVGDDGAAVPVPAGDGGGRRRRLGIPEMGTQTYLLWLPPSGEPCRARRDPAGQPRGGIGHAGDRGPGARRRGGTRRRAAAGARIGRGRPQCRGHGRGPALISELAVASDLAQRTLVEVPTVGIDLRRALRAVWRRGSRPTGPAADLLTSALRHLHRT